MRNIDCHGYEPWLAHDPRVYLTYTARARELQSEAIGRALHAAGRFLVRGGVNAVRWITAKARKRQTMAALARLDDHLLADIGIDREQIPLIAQGLLAPSGSAPRRTVTGARCPPEYRGDAANDSKPQSIAA